VLEERDDGRDASTPETTAGVGRRGMLGLSTTGLVGVGFAVPRRTTRWGENGDGRTADAVRSRVLFAEGTTRVTDVASGANGDVSIAGADYEGTNTRGWVRAIDIDGTVDWEWTADGDYRDSTRMPGPLSSG
jgi:hypothetical protein